MLSLISHKQIGPDSTPWAGAWVLFLVWCDMLQVVSYLTEVERMHVVIEPHMYEQLTLLGVNMEGVFTFTQEESLR